MTSLRPVALADAEELTEIGGQRAHLEPFQWFGWNVRRGLVRTVQEGKTLEEDAGVLAVIDDGGVLVGDVSYRRERWGPAPSYCFELGIVIRLDHRGRGHGSEAQRLMAAYLFEHTAAERVQAATDVDNVAEQRALDRAGFSREGVLRRSQWRAGSWHDLVLFSKLRGEA